MSRESALRFHLTVVQAPSALETSADHSRPAQPTPLLTVTYCISKSWLTQKVWVGLFHPHFYFSLTSIYHTNNWQVNFPHYCACGKISTHHLVLFLSTIHPTFSTQAPYVSQTSPRGDFQTLKHSHLNILASHILPFQNNIPSSLTI